MKTILRGGWPGNKNNIGPRQETVFIKTENFAQQPFHAVARYGIADLAAGYQAHTAQLKAAGPHLRINEKRRMHQPPARFQDSLEVALGVEPFGPPEGESPISSLHTNLRR